MKHLDPRQLPLERSAAASRRVSASGWMMGVLVGAIGLGALGTWVFGAAAGDQVSTDDLNTRNIAFSAVGKLKLQPLQSSEIRNALDQMDLSADGLAKLEAEIAAQTDRASREARQNAAAFVPIPQHLLDAQQLRLVRITLWDTHSQDGDVVALSSAGYRREVVIRNTPQSFVIPADASGLLEIVGIRDGGGGITLGVAGASTKVFMPIMREGQTLPLPIG